MKSLAEIRAKLRQEEEKTSRSTSSGELYRHWDMDVNASARVRFIPDANEDNTFFWIEKMMMPLHFSGIKGQPDSKPFMMRVPCMEMYGEKCPILTEIRPWFNTEMDELGRKYWVKRSFLYAGFVNESPIDEKDLPENPIRLFDITPKIHKIIKSSLMDPDFENTPVDYINGTDFIIEKTKSGEYADYGTSKWARRESSLTEEQLEAIEKFGLKDLASCLPKKPSEEEVEIIFQMFNDSIEGKEYDPDLYGKYFKPYGLELKDTGGSPNTEKKQPTRSVPETKVEEKAETKVEEKVEVKVEAEVESQPEPEAPTKPTGKSASAEDILAALRAKRQSN